MARLGLLAVFPLVAALGACAGAAQSADSEVDEEYGGELKVLVENHSIHDASLFAVSGPQRQSLGIIPASGEGRFTFRWPGARLRFEIRPITGGVRLTDEVLVSPGDELRLRIEPDLRALVVQ